MSVLKKGMFVKVHTKLNNNCRGGVTPPLRDLLIVFENAKTMRTSPIKNIYAFEAKVWLYPGMAGWHFVTLPVKESAQIKKSFAEMAKGWGSLPVCVTVGKTSWNTSIFPDKKSDAYLLPLKAEVRKKEKISAGDAVRLSIEIRMGDMYHTEPSPSGTKARRDPNFD